MAICGKSSCNHCEDIFDSKNKLHDHIRSHECQKLLFSKSDTPIKTALTQLSASETAISDTDIVTNKEGIDYSTHTTVASASAAKSITPYKSSLSTLIHVLDSPANQNTAFDCQKARFECSNPTIKTSSTTTKSNSQTSTTHSFDHLRPIKHGTLIGICVDDVRKHTLSPVDLAVAVKTSTRVRTFPFQQRKSSRDSHQAMRRFNKV